VVLVRAGFARHQKPLVLGGTSGHRRPISVAGQMSFTVTTSDGEAARRWVRIPPPPAAAHQLQNTRSDRPCRATSSKKPTIVRMVWTGRALGIHAGDQGQRLHRGMSLAQTPPGLPLTRRLPGGARLSGAAGGGLLASQGPRCGAPLPPRADVTGPHLGHTPSDPSGSQRSPAVRRSCRSHVRSWGNRNGCGTLIRMRSNRGLHWALPSSAAHSHVDPNEGTCEAQRIKRPSLGGIRSG
jgi:hypothetical protein